MLTRSLRWPSQSLAALAAAMCFLTACLLLLPSGTLAVPVEETRLIAVDMGAEWTKTATLDFTTTLDKPPAVAVNILLNDQANRKSPPCVAFRCSSTSAAGAHGNSTGESGVVCERSFAEEALSLAPRFPTQVVCGPALLLGYTTDEAIQSVERLEGGGEAGNASAWRPLSLAAAEVADHFLYHVAVDPTREAFEVRIPKGTRGATVNGAATNEQEQGARTGLVYSPEELTAMLLGHLTETVRKQGEERNALPRSDFLPVEGGGSKGDAGYGPRVRHAALTVPSFSTVAERQALMDAGEMSGLRVVRLVHSVTAAATALAYYREEQLFPTSSAVGGGAAAPSYVMVYDMGSRQTEAAVFAFAPEPLTLTAAAVGNGIPLAGAAQKRNRRGRVGRLSLLAMSTNRTLGGSAFDRCIASYWDATFMEGRVFARLGPDATPEARREAGKQRAAMLRAANKARERLSANREAPVTVEGVAVAGTAGPFTTTLSRSAFEEICGDLFASAVKVRDEALAATNGAVTSVGQLARFEVVGGAARMPRLLELVSKGYSGGLVDRTLNGDEAVAVGTAYLGATAAGMLPRKFSVREALTNDIGAFLVLTAEATGDASSPKEVIPVLDHSGSSGANPPSSPSAAAGATGEEPVLFPAHRTLLPATKTIVLTNLSGAFTFTLASPPQLAAAVLRTHAAGSAAAAVCPGCFMQHNRVDGIDSALARAALVEKARSHGNVTVTLNATEVVLEATVSESGLPYLRKAYLRAHYVKEEASEGPAGQAERSNTTAAEGDRNQTQGVEAADHEEGSDPLTDAGDVKDSSDDDVTVAGEGETSAATSTGTPSEVDPLTLPRGINLRPSDIEHSRDTLRRLQKTDNYRYVCSHLRNALEGHLISLRALDAYTAETDITTEMLAKAGLLAPSGEASHTAPQSVQDDLLRWRDAVRELSDWLDDYGETATREELAERNRRVELLKASVVRVFAN